MANDYTLNGDGTATFTLENGIVRHLKRPTLGEYRDAVESLGGMRDQVLEETPEDNDGVKKPTVKVQLNILLDWYDTVFEKLGGEGLPKKSADDKLVIDQDLLPPWFLNPEVITDLVAHWQAVPSRRGAR